jgi:Ca2+-transporting ATPase
MFDKLTIMSALVQGLWLFLVTLAAFLISLYRGLGELDARTISFTTLVLGNLALIWANRSRSRTIPEMFASPNYAVWGITAGALALLTSALYVPYARGIFQFSILHIKDLAVCLLLAMLSVTWIEVMKLRHRHGR